MTTNKGDSGAYHFSKKDFPNLNKPHMEEPIDKEALRLRLDLIFRLQQKVAVKNQHSNHKTLADILSMLTYNGIEIAYELRRGDGSVEVSHPDKKDRVEAWCHILEPILNDMVEKIFDVHQQYPITLSLSKEMIIVITGVDQAVEEIVKYELRIQGGQDDGSKTSGDAVQGNTENEGDSVKEGDGPAD